MQETDAKVKNAEQIAIAAELLKVDAGLLDKCLTHRKITRPGSKSVTYAHYSLSKAKDARDAASKALYGKLFDWLITQINRALAGMVDDYKGKDQLSTIGECARMAAPRGGSGSAATGGYPGNGSGNSRGHGTPPFVVVY